MLKEVLAPTVEATASCIFGVYNKVARVVR